jgi:hypothetical protein
MRKYLYSCVLFCLFFIQLKAQSYYFGVKGGPTVGLQNWGGYQRDPLLRYHGDFFIESYGEEESKSSVYMQLGYHIRGSAIRFNNSYYPDQQTGMLIQIPQHTRSFLFRNIALILGAKRGIGTTKAYYMLGLRGEYTFGTNLPSLLDTLSGANIYNAFYPVKEGLQRHRLNYGVSVGVGVNFPFSELVGAFLEASIHPDFSKQYYTPAFQTNYTNQNGTPIAYPEQNIKNVSLEITLGFRFLRKVIYVD